ncbi:hypothetical protein Droror1_Dr00017679, partial [Drosera rotundifolia]
MASPLPAAIAHGTSFSMPGCAHLAFSGNNHAGDKLATPRNDSLAGQQHSSSGIKHRPGRDRA